jgi:hypothetical protein
MPIDQTVAGNLATYQACGILGFQMWSAWGSCAAPIGLTNGITIWIDNIWFETNANPIIIPPTMGLKKSGPSGVLVQMDNNGQWEREGISTPSPNSSSIWTAQGGYPVSYSMTITNFAARAQHPGYEAHMYIVNGDTAGSGNDTSGSVDWNSPDLLLFRIENTANGAMAQIQWKTNYPANNSTNIPVVVFPPAVDGTWTVTFTDSTHGSLSGPGITTTNFTLPSDAVAANFSPVTSFVHFGMFKNDGANDGHNNTASGTFSHVTINGLNAPIDDDFSGLSLTNKYAWRRSNSSVVQYVVPGTIWNVSWSVPAYGFNPYVASSAVGPWNPLTVLNQYQSGTNVYAAIGGSALPAGGSAFFKMAKYPYVKLQVLLPGETAAPNTPTGKTGTPDTQIGGVPFNITVNAVDQYWNVVPTPDYISISSSDSMAILPNPNPMKLVGGTASVQVTLISSGSTTITASDLTDTTITPNTSSPITVP